MREHEGDTSRRLSARIGEYVGDALLVLAGLSIWWVADFFGPRLFERASSALVETSLSAAAQGAFLFVMFMLMPLCGSLYVFWATRNVTADFGWISRVASVVVAAAIAPSLYQAEGALSPEVTSTFVPLVKLLLLAVGLGVAGWILIALARWLIRDERTARAAAK